MRIGILSDSHEELHNLDQALTIFREHEIETVIHCGDITTPRTAARLKGFRVIHVSGNMDRTDGGLRRALIDLNADNFSGHFFTGQLNGVWIAAAHGHQPHHLHTFIADGRYAYIFHGHTHRRRDEWVNKSRVINPGALGGRQPESRSVCIIDLAVQTADEADPVKFVAIPF